MERVQKKFLIVATILFLVVYFTIRINILPYYAYYTFSKRELLISSIYLLLIIGLDIAVFYRQNKMIIIGIHIYWGTSLFLYYIYCISIYTDLSFLVIFALPAFFIEQHIPLSGFYFILGNEERLTLFVGCVVTIHVLYFLYLNIYMKKRARLYLAIIVIILIFVMFVLHITDFSLPLKPYYSFTLEQPHYFLA